MTKSDLIVSMAEKTELSKKSAGAALNAILETITEILVNGDKIQLIGFGTFDVVQRRAKEGRSPRTGEAIHIPASKAPTFKAGAKLKAAVNE